MKNKKKIMIIGIGIIVGLVLIIGGIFLLKKDKKQNIQEVKNIGIIKSTQYEDVKFLNEESNLVLLGNNDSLVILDKAGEKVKEFNDLKPDYYINSRFYNTDFATFIKLDENYMIYDTDFNLIVEAEDELILVDDINKKTSYYIRKNDVYNLNNELVYENIFKKDIRGEYYEIYGNYLIAISGYDNGNNVLIDLNSKEKYTFSAIETFGQNVVLYIENKDRSVGKGAYYVDTNNNVLRKYDYFESVNYGVVLYNEKEQDKILISGNQVINYGDTLEVKGYKFDYTVCENGFKVYDREGNLINDTCYDTYFTDQEDYIFLDIMYTDSDSYDSVNYYLRDDKISTNIPVGKYYISDMITEDYVVVYDADGKELNKSCKTRFDYYKDDLYICGDGQDFYLVDEEFNKVSDAYDEIYCNKISCIVSKENMSGILVGKDIILEPIYNKLNILENGNNIIIEEIFGTKFLALGEGKLLSQEEIRKKIDPYVNLDINEVINENDLDNMTSIINENSELFKKYAFQIEKNKQLGNYKKYVYDTFPVVVDNKEYLDEDYFFSAVRNLYIVDKSNEVNLEANGYYYDANIKIEIFKNWTSVIYHELMHFIDFRLNQDSSLLVYKYKDDYINFDEYLKLPIDEMNKAEMLGSIKASFLTEGGAEINTGIYLNNNIVTTYSTQINVYSILSYIYGSEFMNEVYFSKDGELKLFKKFIEAGYNYNDYDEFITNTTYTYSDTSEKSILQFYDMLIGLYEAQGNSNWYEDKVMSALIKTGLGFYKVKPSYTSRYEEYSKVKFDFNTINEKFNANYKDKYFIYISPSPLVYNDSLFVTFNIKDTTPITTNIEDDKRKYYVAKYDVYTEELSEYKYIEE